LTPTETSVAAPTRADIPEPWRLLVCDGVPGYDPLAFAHGCEFDAGLAGLYTDYIEQCCTHIEGALAGKPFILEDWQRAIVGNIFGWYRQDFLGRRVRRFRKCLIYIPRKNGKSPMAAAIHNAVLFLDPEAGQINNIAASSREQASKLFRHIEGMIRNEPEMAKRCSVYKTTRSITRPDNTVSKVIPADDNVAHGDNQHFGCVDELHAQPNRKLVDTLTTAMASANRIQPLMLFLTTADFDRPSICNEEYEYACKVRDGLDDASYLPVIYEATEADDWTAQAIWEKANPNIRVSVSLDYLRDECRKAQQTPAYENTFKRLHLNIRTGQDERVIQMEKWDACGAAADEDLAPLDCYAALDVGATSDFTALTLLFAHRDGQTVTRTVTDAAGDDQQETFTQRSYTARTFFWLPQHPVRRDARMSQQLDAWARDGHITRTPGEVVDYVQVAGDILDIVQPYRLKSVAVDRGFQGMAIISDLTRTLGEDRVVICPQTLVWMASPFRELLGMISEKRITHDNNPVLRWMASNVAGESRGGLLKPSKEKSNEKIDGITSLTMALGSAMADPVDHDTYEQGLYFA